MNPMLLSQMKERGFVLNSPRKLEKAVEPKHVHAWQYYKKTLGIDRRSRLHTLIFRGCPDCHEKKAIDLKIN